MIHPATQKTPDWRFTPHRYVPSGVPQWRTCKLCGIGANGSIHKHPDVRGGPDDR